MDSLFKALFGRDWLDFSDSLFETQNAKRLGFDEGYAPIDEVTKNTDEELTFRFMFGDDVDASLIKINIDTKVFPTLKATYEKDNENGCIKTSYTRTLSKDVDVKSVNAKFHDGYLFVTFKKLPPEKRKENKQVEIPVSFDE